MRHFVSLIYLPLTGVNDEAPRRMSKLEGIQKKFEGCNTACNKARI